jgi:hypothetical protein
VATKAVFSAKILSDGRVQIDIPVSEPVLQYLDSERITPTVNDGSVRIVIQKRVLTYTGRPQGPPNFCTR